MTDDAGATQWCLPARIHQAEGVLSVRLEISVPEAAVALRAIAHHAGTPLIDVARDVLVDREPG